MASEKEGDFESVILSVVESKADFVRVLDELTGKGESIAELHFVGHAGMYGPMFRTTDMPEQFSPHEWRNLNIPFAEDGTAWFHACRTARWFAPFFARTFQVPAYGYYWYTTFSRRPDRFQWEGLGSTEDSPLYLMGCPGRKSHGLWGSLAKYLGISKAEEIKRYEPHSVGDESTYEQVAELYDEVFEDIRVRGDEWRWISRHLPKAPNLRVLDIGCGNGALLQALQPRISKGLGVDRSAAMINQARARNVDGDNEFFVVDAPRLPLPDQSVDVVISLLSFRYLDWDPIMDEIRRVLVPGGRLLLVDMVTVPLGLKDFPRFLRSALSTLLQQWRNPRFRKALRRLVQDERWQTMIRYNPIRAQHEYVWYLESRFPGRTVETLNVGRHARVLAFDSGPLEPGQAAPQSYP